MKARIILSLLILTLPAIGFAAPRTFAELSNFLVYLLSTATGVLVAVGVAVYFFGISTSMMSLKEKGGEKLKTYFFWGIITIFIMVSIWGILSLLRNTLFGGGWDVWIE